MKIRSEGFKNQIKKMGRELDSKISFTTDGIVNELGLEQLNSVTISYEGNILKSVMKQVEIDSNVLIPVGTTFSCRFGLKVNGEYEYIDFGNFVVYGAEKQEDTDSYKLTCYDKMLYTMTDYIPLPITYPITIREYIKALCQVFGFVFKNENEEFTNFDKQILNELYVDEEGANIGYTFRDVFDELAEVTASTICLNENDELEIRYINETGDTIDEEFFKDINVNFGEKYGVVNSVVLSRGGEGDNIYRKDDASIEANGLTEIKISENQIMNFNNRDEFIDGIFDRLNGLEYYVNDFSSTGIVYYDICDRYNVKIGDNIYSCVMFNDEIIITQGLEENVFTEMPEQTETDYTKADKTDRKVNQAYIIANKQKNQIELVTKEIKSVQDNLTNNYYDIEQSNVLIQNATDGLLNKLSSVGGNNLLKNPIGIFNKDYWEGEGAEPYTDTYIQNKTGQRSCWLLGKGNHLQTIQVKNGIYTFSMMYEKLITLSNQLLKINDVEYELKNDTIITFEVTDNHITIEFVGDVDKSAYLMNLMLNDGEEKQGFTNNANETISDTVMIGKGIQIRATGVNTELDAQADGIRIKNINTNQTTTEFTDKGTITNELNTNKATIAKVLINDTGTQTLFTRL